MSINKLLTIGTAVLAAILLVKPWVLAEVGAGAGASAGITSSEPSTTHRATKPKSRPTPRQKKPSTHSQHPAKAEAEKTPQPKQ